MNALKKYASILTIFTMAGLLPLASTGCARNDGERAGARVDEAADDVGDWTEDRADDVEEAWDEVED